MKTIPIDSARCQSEFKEGSFMTLGPRKYERCESEPTWVAVEVQDGKVMGAMALCDECKAVCEKEMPHVGFWAMQHGEKP